MILNGTPHKLNFTYQISDSFESLQQSVNSKYKIVDKKMILYRIDTKMAARNTSKGSGSPKGTILQSMSGFSFDRSL